MNLTYFPVVVGNGLKKDPTPYALNNTSWRDAEKIRFYEDKIMTIDGWASTLGKVDGVSRTIHKVNNAFVIGHNNGVQKLFNNELTDITPANFIGGDINDNIQDGYSSGYYGLGAYSDAQQIINKFHYWCFADYGNKLIGCEKGNKPVLWDEELTTAQEIVNAPDQCDFVSLSAQKQLFTYGSKDLTNNYNPLFVRWSKIDNIQNWTIGLSSNAGFFQLPEGGQIKAVKEVGNYCIIFTETAIYRRQFIASVSQVYRFDKISSVGCLGQNAVATNGNDIVFWVGSDYKLYFYSVNGTNTQVVDPFYIEDDFKINKSQSVKTVVFFEKKYNEVQIYFAGDTLEIEKAYFYSLTNETWSKSSIDATAIIYDEEKAQTIFIDTNQIIYIRDEQTGFAGQKPFNAYIESNDLYFTETENTEIKIREVVPNIKEGSSAFVLEIYVKASPQDEYEKDPIFKETITDTTRKLNLRVNGRIFKLRIKTFGKSLFKLGGLSIGVLKSAGSRRM